MNLRKIFLFTLAFSISVFAGKVITYTASSAESQEQANNTAIAGVAKQVSAHFINIIMQFPLFDNDCKV